MSVETNIGEMELDIGEKQQFIGESITVFGEAKRTRETESGWPKDQPETFKKKG
ncbi:hypothetical protein [Neobacillus mesonae]|uniref:hypothetical protein n=1 Tax=Neobacillus mesonae TaxID=1193713 RepID=UPI002E1ED4D3|nr:hypothetical protein [Neobacillus mesonae]